MLTQILPYQKNSAALFEHFIHLPYPIFLDSCLQAQQQGRFDIFSADPVTILTPSDNIFEDVARALSELKNNTSAENVYDLPFTIGAMGYFSYDAARSLEKIPSIAKDDIDLPVVHVGIYHWSMVVDHQEKKIFLTTDTELAQKKILSVLNNALAHPEKFSLTKKFQSNMSRQYYQDAFHQIKQNIIAGNCYQVNLAQRFSAEFSGSSWEAYKILREKNPAPYAAFLKLDHASILSLSPERFIKITGKQVETQPIKGTSKRFEDPAQDQLSAQQLLISEKDRAENIMIVDLLRNDLSRSCTHVVVKKLCALESFKAVHHLVSTITAIIEPKKTHWDVFKNAFPGGSITGAPKIAAMKIIESLEPHRRSLYCGNIFYADIHDHFDSNIAIRTAICDKNKMHCYAGGGIVFDSDCEAEYNETLMKIGKIIDVLPLLRHPINSVHRSHSS